MTSVADAKNLVLLPLRALLGHPGQKEGRGRREGFVYIEKSFDTTFNLGCEGNVSVK